MTTDTQTKRNRYAANFAIWFCLANLLVEVNGQSLAQENRETIDILKAQQKSDRDAFAKILIEEAKNMDFKRAQVAVDAILSSKILGDDPDSLDTIKKLKELVNARANPVTSGSKH